MIQVELGEIADFINGAAFKPEDWGEEGARIIRIQNLNDPSKPFNRTVRQVHEKYNVYPGTLLVSWSASLGVFEWNEPDTALLNQHIFKVVPDERRVRQDYLRLMLTKALKDMEKHAHGSTMLHVNRGEFLGTKIPLPPLEEQKRIAAILDQAEDIRRKRQHAIYRLNQLGQAIFHEMFGDPVTNPMRWPVFQLGDVVRSGDKINYGVVQPGEDVEEGIPLIRVGDLLSGHINPANVKQIDPVIEENYKRSRLVGDEILIGCVGSIGSVALAHEGLRGANIARAVARVPVDPMIASREFIAEQIKSPFVQRYFAAETRTVAQPTLNIGLIVSAPIIIPPLDEQGKFSAAVSDVRIQLSAMMGHASRTDSLFTSLQHRAFTGQL